MIGMGVALRSWGAVLMLRLASAVVYGYRIRVEEKAQVAMFGEEYLGLWYLSFRFIISIAAHNTHPEKGIEFP